MPNKEIVSFVGLYSWPGLPDAPSVFDVELRQEAGIYLWTVPLEEGHLIYYVGETGRGFGTRLQEQYMQHATAMYHVYSPSEFARGEKVALWPGRFDPSDRRSVPECIANYSHLCGPGSPPLGCCWYKMPAVEWISGTETALLGEKCGISTPFFPFRRQQHSTGGLPKVGSRAKLIPGQLTDPTTCPLSAPEQPYLTAAFPSEHGPQSPKGRPQGQP